MTLQNNSLNSLLKDNSRALKPYIIFKTCVCFKQKHPRSQRFTLHFSFCLFSKCTVMVYLLNCTEAKCFLPRPFSIVIHFELINISQKMNRAGCHSYFSPRLEIMTMIGQNLMVVNGLLEWKRKVGTKRSWLDIMSWLDMHWYRGGKRDESYLAMSLDTLVIILVHWVQKFWYWGGFVAIKTNFCFECHVWTSAKNNTPWKQWEKCLWAWPLCW